MGSSQTLMTVIRQTIKRDERSRYRLSKESGVNQAVLGRFVKGERDLNLRTADRLCKVLGLELRPAKRK